MRVAAFAIAQKEVERPEPRARLTLRNDARDEIVRGARYGCVRETRCVEPCEQECEEALAVGLAADLRGTLIGDLPRDPRAIVDRAVVREDPAPAREWVCVRAPRRADRALAHVRDQELTAQVERAPTKACVTRCGPRALVNLPRAA